MYIESPDEAKHLAAGLRKRSRAFTGVDAWIAPSFIHMPVVAAALKGSNIKVGGQAVSRFEMGAYTGEVSAAMLKQSGASFCLVGHSERRAIGDTNEIVHEQLVHVTSAGLTAILCVGETERDATGTHFTTITEQLSVALAGMHPFSNKIIIAYEPVWAIGKHAGNAMPASEVQETVIFIRKTLADIVGREKALKIPILYGGSVEGENAGSLMREGEVHGFLVGHASTTLDSFVEILKQCRK
jgi:triosephosphate isomerase